MSVLRKHLLVRADISEAINWYEDQRPGLGSGFTADFLIHYRHLARDAQLYAVRFADASLESGSAVFATETVKLECQVSALANQAYGLSHEGIALLWQTAPPRVPIPQPST